MRVGEAGHQQPALQVHRRGARSGPLAGLGSTDGEDRTVTYDDDAVRALDTEHPAAGQHEVGHASSTYVRGTRAPIRVTIS